MPLIHIKLPASLAPIVKAGLHMAGGVAETSTEGAALVKLIDLLADVGVKTHDKGIQAPVRDIDRITVTKEDPA